MKNGEKTGGVCRLFAALQSKKIEEFEKRVTANEESVLRSIGKRHAFPIFSSVFVQAMFLFVLKDTRARDHNGRGIGTILKHWDLELMAVS